ncbi:MAG TPA: trypsin-like peptidase domain-containing protein [Bryobacteraceae bacterium]|nr:trypsin-like peptidase domain-containing protein [Bryobacteraceae bacterium]
MRFPMTVWVPALLAVGPLAGQPTPHRDAVSTVLQLSESFERLAQSTSRAVVQVNVSGYAITPEEGNNVAALTRERGVGSGVILSADGYIVTNAHVVRSAQKVAITLRSNSALPAQEDSARAIPARIVGMDTETDLALLKIERKGLHHVALANSDLVRQGQIVVAFGSPLGLSNSMTMGMVSAPARQIKEEDFMQYIQTDTPINPGNSGGPLVDATGAVIGINTMILSQSGGSEGVGLAIPSNLVRAVVAQLTAHGRVHRGMIGANAQTLTPTLSEGLSLPVRNGVLITDVLPNGPAYEGGLRIGDVATRMNDIPLRNARQLELAVFRARSDQKLRLHVLREGSDREIEITVAERPNANDGLLANANPKENLVPQLGILGLTVDKRVASLLPGLREPIGVVVAALAHEPTAWTSQLEPGDVIHDINGSPIPTLEILRQKLAAMSSGAAIVLKIERGETMRYVAFRAD